MIDDHGRAVAAYDRLFSDRAQPRREDDGAAPIGCIARADPTSLGVR